MDLSNIRTDARFMISPQVTSTEYPDVDLDRNANLWYRTVLSWAIEDQGQWELRGDILYRDLAIGVTDYEIPAAFVRIYKAEVMYTSGAGFVEANVISVQANQGTVEGNSTRTIDDVNAPTIELFGDILQLRPAPTEATVNGFKIWCQVDFQDMVNAHDVPDFSVIVHRVLSTGAALDFAMAEEMSKKEAMLRRVMYGDPSKENDKGLRGQVASLFANRVGTSRDQFSARRKNFK